MTIKFLATSSKALVAVGFVGLISLTTLSGCSTTPPKSMMNVQAGEYFVLKQPINIPAEKVRHYIQFGKLNGGGFNSYEQHCRIELYSLLEQPTTINPQSFLIDRVATGEELIAQAKPTIHFADNRAGLEFAAVQNDAPPLTTLAFGDNQRPETMELVHLYLKSDSQPNVYRLTCAGSLSDGSLQDAPQSYRPQREEINRILGEVGEIKPQ